MNEIGADCKMPSTQSLQERTVKDGLKEDWHVDDATLPNNAR
jgi:hypothetical protein